jgi:hypothetical protein
MNGRKSASRSMSRGGLLAALVALGLAACSGARHRRVQGPPPEYEPPDDPAALDAGAPPSAAPLAPSPVRLDAGGPEAAR